MDEDPPPEAAVVKKKRGGWDSFTTAPMLERWLRAQRCSLLDAYELDSPGGIAREADGRQIWPRVEGTPEPPPTAHRATDRRPREDRAGH